MVFILSLMLPFIHSRATVAGRLWPLWSSPVSVMGLDLRASGVTSDYIYPLKSNRNPSYGASNATLHETAGRHHQIVILPTEPATQRCTKRQGDIIKARASIRNKARLASKPEPQSETGPDWHQSQSLNQKQGHLKYLLAMGAW
eukprot:SAG31_NODE_848_length_11534_cov_8.897463_5_plen_144_part_00